MKFAPKFAARLAAGGLLTAGGMVMALGQGLAVLAGSNSANITISAFVEPSCTITSQSIAPGGISYDPGATTDLQTGPLGTANVTCNVGTTPTALTLDEGANKCTAVAGFCTAASTPTAPLRQMINGSSKLVYNIFASAANQTTGTPAVAWGTANGPTLVAGTGAPQTYQLFMRIPKNQNLASAIYTDTMLETVSF